MKLLSIGLLLVSSLAWAQYGDDPYAQPPPDPYAQPQQQPQYQQYGYVGPHPMPYEYGSGYCYQGGAHFHEYPPFDQNLFREQSGYFYFVGDPGDFGYQRQLWGYRGHHPIPYEWGGNYCYIDWPHRHPYAPPSNLAFNYIGGYYVYGGVWDPSYYTWRSRYAPYWGGYYRSTYFGNRYYSVRPPAVYRPSLHVGAPGVYRPGVTVVAPGGGARVVVPAPGRVVVPAPGRVVVPAPGRVVVPAPVVAPPPGRVYAPAPAPVMRAPAPAPVVRPPAPVAPPPRVVAPAPRGPAPPGDRRRY